MWIKSLDTDVWVNMKHVTHFETQLVVLGLVKFSFTIVLTYISTVLLSSNALKSNLYDDKVFCHIILLLFLFYKPYSV